MSHRLSLKISFLSVFALLFSSTFCSNLDQGLPRRKPVQAAGCRIDSIFFFLLGTGLNAIAIAPSFVECDIPDGTRVALGIAGTASWLIVIGTFMYGSKPKNSNNKIKEQLIESEVSRPSRGRPGLVEAEEIDSLLAAEDATRIEANPVLEIPEIEDIGVIKAVERVRLRDRLRNGFNRLKSRLGNSGIKR